MMNLINGLHNLSRKEREEYLQLLEIREARKAKETMLAFARYTCNGYKVNFHHDIYCKKIDEFIAGDIKNLMVFMPPQHGKSEISTRRTPAKMLGDNPDLKIGVAAYNHTVAAKFNRDVQRIIESEEYRKIYPDTKLNSANARTFGTYLKNSDEFEVVGREGSLVSVGVGGGLTSRKLDIAIMDDLYKDAADAWSPVKRESVQDWYDTVLRTRLHNNSQQLLVNTRWHEDDLSGHLLRTEPEKWEVVLFEAIKQTDSAYDNRAIGEPLWPEQHHLDTLLNIKKNNPVVFESLYQQNPTPKEGLLMPVSELKWFKSDMLTQEPDSIVAVGDIADEGTDSLCVPIGLVYGPDVYIVDVLFTQEPIEVTQPLTASLLDKYNVDMVRFESNNGGKGFSQKVQELKHGKTTVTWKQTTKNKHTRILMKSGQIKEHFYFRSDGSEEYKKYVYELTHYPKNGKTKHDDAIDATTMLAEFVFKPNTWGWN